jgi:hypothetical protein
MTNESVPADSPRELLTLIRDLTRQVRSAQRGTWFPLLVLAAITLGAIPINRYGTRHPGGCRYSPGPAGQTARECWSVAPWQLTYWPIALILAYVAIAGFYIYQSRRRGVGTRIQPYAVVGVIIAVLVTAATLWQVHQPPSPGDPEASLTQIVDQLRSPAAAIGLALLALAWAERNRALVWFSLAYLVVVLTPISWFPGGNQEPGQWGFLPRLLIIAGVLLLGSLYFATVQPTTRSRAQ